MNDRGYILLEFADKYKLVIFIYIPIANILHLHKNSIITTWHSPNGLVYNQIYYILTPQRFKLSIIQVQRELSRVLISTVNMTSLYAFKTQIMIKQTPKKQNVYAVMLKDGSYNFQAVLK